MDVSLSETQRLIQDSVKAFVESEIPFSRIREVESSGDMDRKLWKELAELGWLGLPLAEEHGGQAGGLADAGVLIEALTRRAVLVPIAESVVAAATLQRHAPTDVAADILPDLANGTSIAVPAVLEQEDSFKTWSIEVGADGTLTGKKYFVDYGGQATHHLVAARSDGEPGLYLVQAQTPAVTTSAVQNIGKVPQAIVTYEGAAATRVCGQDGYEFLVGLGRLLAAIQCVACSQQALDMTVDYVAMRVQFGQPIGTFQAVQHHCANMATHTLASRYLVFEALWRHDRGEADDTQIAVAKTQASRTATEVTMMAHQLHGGMGLVTEYDLHFFSLRGKQAALSWGSSEECLGLVSDTIEEPEQWL
ncbi:MAG: acyl-CoA dehydrogenase family protein [Pseudomonadales bacterium]|jgi:alkylation response protein AidB-like acyl-CoA dehydrogenase|nr:acyl-CoA dehydrogenase family protein [Pseudomonadales bacterium]MDP7357004.1 acyl-CoA dehydrogenase family protein [Pseudomonadales bacterium]MDP7596058.1 acyl-CoA dehydrogenase family protein [Pseudomonadales bacterium]HJN50547.1 acyl-CoA dehydrogenase family protein [Pseudomonadales bacterium]|tara:strand:- start:3107 stop:4195 length:1089 start_codon:yes stop_codon:yes gene_type:complete